jgi:hypothetical protein
MKNRLQFKIIFESEDLHNEWTDEEWEYLSTEIYSALEEIHINISLSDKSEDKNITLTPLYFPEILNNKE